MGISGRAMLESKFSGIAHGPVGGGASTPIAEIDRRSGSWSASNIRIPVQQGVLRMLESKDH